MNGDIDLYKLERHFRHGEKDPAGWPERDVLALLDEVERLRAALARIAALDDEYLSVEGRVLRHVWKNR